MCFLLKKLFYNLFMHLNLPFNFFYLFNIDFYFFTFFHHIIYLLLTQFNFVIQLRYLQPILLNLSFYCLDQIIRIINPLRQLFLNLAMNPNIILVIFDLLLLVPNICDQKICLQSLIFQLA